MFVRRAYLYHCNIARKCSATVEFLRLAQEYRDVVGISFLDTFADIGSDEKSLVEKNAFKLRVCIRGWTFGVKMVHFHISNFSGFPSATHCIDQDLRCAGHAAQVHVVA